MPWLQTNTQSTLAVGRRLLKPGKDSCPTALARHLYQELCRRGCRAAYLDADMGQSTLGLPTTLNLALSSEEPRPQARASSKEKASGHFSTGSGILAFSREPGDDRFPPQGRQVTFISSMRFVEL